MKNGLLAHMSKGLVGTFTVIGALWTLFHIVFEPVQYVALCNATRSDCETIRAEFSFDFMDAQFVIDRLYLEDGVITFGPTDCWVAQDGSACMHSSTNQNNTGIENVIVPLSLEGRKWRWE